MDQFLKVGVISSTHGIRGEVKVFPTTDSLNRFKKLKDVMVSFRGENIPLEVEGVKFFKQFAILKFKDIDSINDVEKYKGMDLLVDRKNAVKLEKNEYFKADLLGLKAISDDEQYKGVLDDILETGANDVYVIKLEDGRELLLPAIKECVLDVDLKNTTLKFHLMDGLL